MGHLDVVPADDTEAWEVPPFLGSIHDGYFYGRGTVDDKHTVFVSFGILHMVLKFC